MDRIEKIISEHPFFSELDPDYLDLILPGAKEMEFKTGEYIFREGGEADKLYLIIHGKVSVEMYATARGPLVIETLDDGDVLGWSWFVAPYKKRFDTRVVENTKVVVMDAVLIREQCEKNHDFGYEILKRTINLVAHRLQAARLRLLDFYSL